MEPPLPLGPKRVLEQATAAGFEVAQESASSPEAGTFWVIRGSKDARSFYALWSKPVSDKAGVKAVGIWTVAGGVVTPIKLTDLRTWLAK